ncbi:hypothetical protein [Helicobacter cetorum]|uniref:hypothetical protein n=1 Tax=Helicobacter cetorum TaxID=138563 RepID=UPI000CF03895|nr:hypothetical protein [Helicobacter cetorum]
MRVTKQWAKYSNLSLNALGILAFLESLEYSQTSQRAIKNRFNLSEQTLNKYLKELEIKGALSIEKQRDKKGRFTETRSLIFKPLQILTKD